MTNSWAKFSSDRRYRYLLVREWGNGPMINFIGLNPSTADETQDDPTIRRCLGFARDWGYGTLLMTNLYAWRATDPQELSRVDDPVGKSNDRFLQLADLFSDMTLAAWGAHPMAAKRVPDVIKLLGPFYHVLGFTKGGHPRHPLYIPKHARPVKWRS